ncbi:DUF3261 domain-containing protein [Caulobacter sp. NIBR1757]|uniref:DUF3261 domain-containing protein n=1 Tax=Caulobacter sp. NIBR1757 TaxID=3016000 RepID=UPI0022F0DF38|nr:DUF3261 domain-containing protein [Caulobacter sp. NIBR1757]WGM40549.1 hypothetical protein AMEJIAPC_03494 [Caulobacter sp. NIBR1757]
MTGRLLTLLLAGTLLAGCVTGPPAGPPPPAGVAAVARDRVYLTLPLPPAYPGEKEMAQSIVAQYGPRKVAFDALVSLSPQKVTVIVTAPAGPRVAQIDWDATGVRTKTDGAPPPGFRGENVLADLVMTSWPRTALEKALGGRLEVWDYPDGHRKLVRDRELVVDIPPAVRDADGSSKRTLTNHDFGYTLTIVSREAGQ